MLDNACEYFTPPTNGDRIRQMSDEEFVATIKDVKNVEKKLDLDDDE